MCGDQLKGYIMRRQIRNDDGLDWGDDSEVMKGGGIWVYLEDRAHGIFWWIECEM